MLNSYKHAYLLQHKYVMRLKHEKLWLGSGTSQIIFISVRNYLLSNDIYLILKTTLNQTQTYKYFLSHNHISHKETIEHFAKKQLLAVLTNKLANFWKLSSVAFFI